MGAENRRHAGWIVRLERGAGAGTVAPQLSVRYGHGTEPDAALTRTGCGPMSDNQGMAEAIARDAETMHGVPMFLGTRVPVQTLFDYLEGGDTLEDFLEGFPTVPRALALEEARQLPRP